MQACRAPRCLSLLCRRHIQRTLFPTRRHCQAPEFPRHRASSTATTWRHQHDHTSPSSSVKDAVAIDHRDPTISGDLFTTTHYSPGSPLFYPDGAIIFNRLVAFLRAQYPQFGIREVITPNIYKKALWERSGHWDNYAEDMFSVTGRGCCGGTHGTAVEDDTKLESGHQEDPQIEEEQGLKPMNCPGHCLLFASKPRSYRELPIRFADFSSLHRNEGSGALSGLTRVRRFHQDDGHIFCRPSQIRAEIETTLAFVRMAYNSVFKPGPYRLVLSTRPETNYIGTTTEWAHAESQLLSALSASGESFTISPGDGAFYGPKIDIIVTAADGKEHQTATIQLDFQLPKRFALQYTAKAPDLEQRGESTDALADVETGPATPVLIHRAVLGSAERFMALLIERHGRALPFWLSPRQAVVLAVSQDDAVLRYADQVVATLRGCPTVESMQANGSGSSASPQPQPMNATVLSVGVDGSARRLQKKIKVARDAGWHFVVVVGKQDVEAGTVVVQRCVNAAESTFPCRQEDGSWDSLRLGDKQMTMTAQGLRASLEKLSTELS